MKPFPRVAGVAVTTNYKADCLPCHVPAKKDDWIYIRGYPELKN